MTEPYQHKLSVLEKTAYSGGDAAANFVFMTMILFQTNFYTDVFGLSATAAAAILLGPRLWDAVFDPVMGVLADRTRTRWGRFRPWVLWTSVPWAIVMILAYTTPHGWSMGALIAYAAITNAMLMTLYSMNNMPYSALGGVMTGDLDERTKLNSYRFVAVNIAQFVVGGFTLPLVAKFAAGHDRQYGWRMTMTVWAVLCLVLFLITFLATRERVQPVKEEKTSPRQDFADLLKNIPWRVMFVMTLIHFAILSFRGGALYNYYHHYADKAAMYDATARLGLTAPAGASGGGLLETLGYVVHGDKSSLAGSNVADVFYSIINMVGQGTTIIVIILSPPLSRRFGKKAIAVVGFALASLGTFAFYLLPPANVIGMLALTILIAVFLRSDHPAGVGHLRRRCRLLGMDDWTPLYRHGVRHDRFRAEGGVGLGLGLVLVDHAGFLQLRHQAPQCARGRDRLPLHQRHCGRAPLRDLHCAPGGLQAEQGHHPADGRRVG